MALFADLHQLHTPRLRIHISQGQIREIPQVLHMVDNGGTGVSSTGLAHLALVFWAISVARRFRRQSGES